MPAQPGAYEAGVSAEAGRGREPRTGERRGHKESRSGLEAHADGGHAPAGHPPGCAPSVWDSGAKGQARVGAAKAGEGADAAADPVEAWTNTSAPAEARLGENASCASACLCVIRGCMFLLSLTAPCQA